MEEILCPKKLRLLITGASGFLGRIVTKKIAAENKWMVYAVTSGRRYIDFPSNVEVVSANLLDETNRRQMIESIQPNIILHLAWYAENVDANSNIKWLEASLHLMRLFANVGGERFLFAGTCQEIRSDSGKRKEQNCNIEMLSVYGASKRAFSNIASIFFVKRDIGFVNLRYFTIYGPGDDGLLPAIPAAIRAFLRREIFVCKCPNNIWDYVYIDDSAEATLKILESEFCGVINIASGFPLRMKEVFTIIANIMNSRNNLVFENQDICKLVLVGDTAILEEKLGYKCKTSFEEGIKKTIEYFVNLPCHVDWKGRV
jgi:nucleoside-diphosphate-sugar epimerase